MRGGNKDIVDLLIKNKADINCKDVCGFTPLIWGLYLFIYIEKL